MLTKLLKLLKLLKPSSLRTTVQNNTTFHELRPDLLVIYPVWRYIEHSIQVIQKASVIIKPLLPKGRVVFVGTGTSGAVIGVLLAKYCNTDYQHIFKSHEDSHTRPDLSGLSYDLDEYDFVFFVDDLISSGQTMRRMITTVATTQKTRKVLIGGVIIFSPTLKRDAHSIIDAIKQTSMAYSNLQFISTGG